MNERASAHGSDRTKKATPRSARASEAIRIALKGAEPTEEQWEAISQPLQPVHLVAAAGSGKTAVMAARIVWIMETHGFSPAQILGLTFTNKAAEELQRRVRAAVAAMPGLRPEEITVQTYHAFAAGIVREHGLLVGVEPEAGLLSEAQQWQVVLSCLDEVPPFEAIELRSSAALVRAALALATSLSDHMVAISDVEAAAERISASVQATEEMRDTANKRKELCRVVEAYVRAKRRLQRIDFGDQVSKAVEILESHAHVCAAYRARFPVVLLDEYQDTNVAQRRLLQALVAKGGALTAVGDARQAIYAFRGATMYNLLEFPSHFPRAGADSYAELSISDNFRSGARILDVANRVVEPIPEERRPGKRLRPAKEKDGRPLNGDGRVLLGLFEDERAEADWIAQRCDALHGQALDAAAGRRLAWSDMAILVRRKAAMGALLAALEARDIPVEVVGLGGLLKTPEVTEIVSWLRALETKPSANRWLARVLLGPRWRVHYRDLALCARWVFDRNYDYRLKLAAGDEDLAREMEPGDVGFALAEALDHVDEIEGLGPEARRRLQAFAQRLQALRAQVQEPLLDLVQEVIATSGIADALEASSSRVAAAGKQNVANFLDQVAAFAPIEGESTLRSFLAYLDAAEDAEETLEATQPAEHDSVKLMTAHAAKGLEFECVFVPSVAAGRTKSGDYNALTSIFPNLRTSDPLRSYDVLPYEVREDAGNWPKWDGDLEGFKREVRARTLEDERRLFYVALTRARRHLAVTAAWWYGRDRAGRGPSQFWDELYKAAGEHRIDVICKAEAPEENPAVDALGDIARWPPEARAGAEDPLFDDGWGAAADDVVSGRVNLDDLARALDEQQRAELARLSALYEAELEAIASARREPHAARPEVPDVLSATQQVALARGEIGPWELVRPLPERPAPSRRLGTEIHRLIEERHRGLALYPEESELDEPAQVADGGRISELLRRWNELGYAERKPARLPSGEAMVELPFTLRRQGRMIRGRIDAVYEIDDGGVEIVDFKTGGRAFLEDEAGEDQLSLYAAALEANGLLPQGKPVVLTYAFLDAGPPVSRLWRSAPEGSNGGYAGTATSGRG